MAAPAPQVEVYPTQYGDVTQVVIPPTVYETVQALGYHHLGDLYTEDRRIKGERALKERAPARKGIPGLKAWLARHSAVLAPLLWVPPPRWHNTAQHSASTAVLHRNSSRCTTDRRGLTPTLPPPATPSYRATVARAFSVPSEPILTFPVEVAGVAGAPDALLRAARAPPPGFALVAKGACPIPRLNGPGALAVVPLHAAGAVTGTHFIGAREGAVVLAVGPKPVARAPAAVSTIVTCG